MWLTLGLVGLGVLLFFAGRKVERTRIDLATERKTKKIAQAMQHIRDEVAGLDPDELDRLVFGPRDRSDHNK